jgi:Leucine-rich repeat (LRR) protein
MFMMSTPSLIRVGRLLLMLLFLIGAATTFGNNTAQSANLAAFLEYASSDRLTPDETYTIELLIDRLLVNSELDDFESSSARRKAREQPDYQPSISRKNLKAAAAYLDQLTWVNLQRLRDSERPVRDLRALRFFPNLKSLFLQGNEIGDVAQLGGCEKLQELDLSGNPVRDLAGLAACPELEELGLQKIPAADFSILSSLPKLRCLHISASQTSAFRKLQRLPMLQKLEFDYEVFDSFEGFPEMPVLRVISGAEVSNLGGIERYRSLENLVSVESASASLAPLAALQQLTHVNLHAAKASSLEPLAGLGNLRSLWLRTEVANLDISPLRKLRMLHDVTVKCGEMEAAELAELRQSLSSWDTEFRSHKARHTPSLQVEVVDQKTFDHYDTVERFGITSSDRNEQLLESELEWLDEQIEQALLPGLKSEEDIYLPFQWGGARSRTLVLKTDEALHDFPNVVLKIQKVLCHAHRDWIIYLQDEDSNFVAWVYPNKIMLTQEHEKIVRRLIKAR